MSAAEDVATAVRQLLEDAQGDLAHCQAAWIATAGAHPGDPSVMLAEYTAEVARWEAALELAKSLTADPCAVFGAPVDE